MPQQKSQAKNTSNNAQNEINTLRVAQAELASGNTQGKVFMRLSEGAAALLVERPKAQDQVDADLRNKLLDQSSLPTSEKS
jgi:hypothetical protein